MVPAAEQSWIRDHVNWRERRRRHSGSFCASWPGTCHHRSLPGHGRLSSSALASACRDSIKTFSHLLLGRPARSSSNRSCYSQGVNDWRRESREVVWQWSIEQRQGRYNGKREEHLTDVAIQEYAGQQRSSNED